MESGFWFIVIGTLLIAMNVGGAVIARLPLSPAILYFGVGVALGPWGTGSLTIRPEDHAVLIERVCEAAVLVSLFAAGSNLGGTLRGRHWNVPIRLASWAMLVTIAGLTAFAYGVLQFSLGASVLLAAILAPTDPVLASEVQVENAADRDRLRFGLTGEAGLNDGAAFPFVMLGLGLLQLHEIGAGGWRWWVVDLAWAIGAGLGIGALFGVGLGRVLVRPGRDQRREPGTDAFLGLGLVGLAYGAAVALHAYGFLAVFAAAVGLQWTVAGAATAVEGASAVRVAEGTSTPGTQTLATPIQRFNAHLDSLFEFGVVMMVGAYYALARVPLEAIAMMVVLFFVVRPAAVFVGLYGTRLDREQRVLAAWFGIRGVGSIYYAMYAINHGLPPELAQQVLGITTGVVVASIFLHGISVTPLMALYGRGKARIARKATRKSVP